MTRDPHSDSDSAAYRPKATDLGEPLSIRDVANVLGCSPWSVRQQLLRQGLPHFRSVAGGKLIFYRNQVIRWILVRQGQPQGGPRL